MAGVEAWDSNWWGSSDTATVENRNLFLYTGILDRCIWRYKENAYRRVLLDAGATLGNTVMHAHAIGLNGSSQRFCGLENRVVVATPFG